MQRRPSYLDGWEHAIRKNWQLHHIQQPTVVQIRRFWDSCAGSVWFHWRLKLKLHGTVVSGRTNWICFFQSMIQNEWNKKKNKQCQRFGTDDRHQCVLIYHFFCSIALIKLVCNMPHTHNSFCIIMWEKFGFVPYIKQTTHTHTQTLKRKKNKKKETKTNTKKNKAILYPYNHSFVVIDVVNFQKKTWRTRDLKPQCMLGDYLTSLELLSRLIISNLYRYSNIQVNRIYFCGFFTSFFFILFNLVPFHKRFTSINTGPSLMDFDQSNLISSFSINVHRSICFFNVNERLPQWNCVLFIWNTKTKHT